MSTVRAVFFGLRGVLVEYSSVAHRRLLAEVARAVAAPAVEFAAAWEERRERREVDRHGTVEDDLDDVLRRLGVFARADQRAAAIDLLIESERSPLSSPRPGAIQVLTALRGRDLRTGVIANTTALAARLWPDSPLAPYFDAVVFSSEVGHRKPDRRIFALACERLGVAPPESTYVSAAPPELLSAAAAGMTTVLLVPPMADGDESGWHGPRVLGLDGLLAVLDAATAGA